MRSKIIAHPQLEFGIDKLKQFGTHRFLKMLR